jgi:NADH:ubiquinone oxidoreductase subunit 4 (subunit M)
MAFIIGIWGTRSRKIHAVYQFIFFTMAGSFLMLTAILVLYSNLGTVDLRYLYHIDLSFGREIFV